MIPLSIACIARDEGLRWPQFIVGVDRLRQYFPDLECVVVVDSRSIDNTGLLAAESGFKVELGTSTDLGLLKEQARLACSGKWVLSLDIDEVPSVDAALSVWFAVESPKSRAYLIHLHTLVGDVPLRIGPFAAEYRLRLFPREDVYWSSSHVHEEAHTHLEIGELKGIFEHHSFSNIEDLEYKYRRYGTDAALKRGGGCHPLRAAVSALWRGARYLSVYGGATRGVFGWRIAAAQASYTWVKWMA